MWQTHMRQTPFVSVIVTAFNRREFLSKAIDSVAAQTLEKSRFELIVMKNFSDPEIDSKIAKLNALTFLMGKESMGAYLTLAIQNASGQVLVFLDDDDEFERDRLEIIDDLFSRNEELSYYHNGRTLIDPSGKASEGFRAFRPEESENLQRTGSFLVKAFPLKKEDAERLYMVQAFNYKSCLAIRKKAVEPFLDYFRLINRAPDYFMFYAALASECALAIDSRRLTRYRLHGSNISLFGNKPRTADLLIEYMDHVRTGIKTLGVILQMLHRANAPMLVRKMALHDLRTLKVDLDSIDPSCTKGMRFLDLAKYLGVGFRATFYAQNMSVLYSLISVFFPRFAYRWFIFRKIYRQ